MKTTRCSRLCFGLMGAAVCFAAHFVVQARAQDEADPVKPPTTRLHVLTIGDEDAQLMSLETEYDGQGSPQWSSDGKWIAFDAWRESQGENYVKARMFIVSPNGKELQDLGEGAMPSFSADGRRIAFSRYSPNNGVWTMNVDGSQRELLDAEGWSAKWSPDGKKIAYTVHRGHPNIVLYDVNEKTKTNVLSDEHSQMYSSIYWNFCWSPDSKRLCFRAHRPDDTYDVSIADAAGSDKGFHVRLQQTTGNEFSWHPDGKLILLAMPDPMRKNRQLFTIDPDTKGQPRRVPGQPIDRLNSCGAWSADGKRIAFSSREIVRNKQDKPVP